jgi:hypothetical protein
MSAREKRAAPRIQPYLASCRLRSPERAWQGYVTDLSQRGARVVCEREPPEPGTRVTLDVRFKGRLTHSRLAAEVKWARPSVAGDAARPGGEGISGYTLGLGFVRVSAENRRLIESEVESFRQQAAQLAEKS